MREIIDTIKKAFERAKKMSKEELPSGYTKLGEYEDIVLAGKEMNNRAFPQGYQFVTWQRDYSGGMSLGHYFTSFESAQRDFTERCELQTQVTPFNSEEYYHLQSAVIHALETLELESGKKEILQNLNTKILEQINPSIKRNIMFDESELFMIKAGLVKAGTFPDLDHATRKGIGQIVEKIEAVEPEALDEYVYDNEEDINSDELDFERE